MVKNYDHLFKTNAPPPAPKVRKVAVPVRSTFRARSYELGKGLKRNGAC